MRVYRLSILLWVETNINNAGYEALQDLRGIGPKRARQIVLYRETIEGITSVDQLAEAARISLREAERINQALTLMMGGSGEIATSPWQKSVNVG